MTSRMKKIISQLFSGFILLTLLASFSGKKNPDFKDRILFNFNRFLMKTLDEKLYLQTDKPYYSAGENIWFKGYLVNSATLRQESLSKFIYVELINRMDSVIYRVKVAKDSTGFAGQIKLKPDLPMGDYNLRAYTYWMQNNSSDFFFRKNIYIGNQIDDRVSCKATYGEYSNGQLPVNLNFTDESSSPVSADKVQITGQWPGSGKKKLIFPINAEGNLAFEIPYDPATKKPDYLDVSINQESLKYKTRIFLPDFSKDFDVQFFPESGVFLDNNLQVLAFKAIGSDGLSVAVNGEIYSNDDAEQSSFSSQEHGMGKLLLNTSPGKTYYAKVTSAKGIEKRFELPQTQPEGIALHLSLFRETIMYELIDQRADKLAPVYMLIHSNGNPYVVMPVSNFSGKIQGSNFPAGIFALSIIDSLGNTLCERLFFKNGQNQPGITFQADKEIYGKRDPIDLHFKVQSNTGQTASGNFAISVTDDRFVKLDSTADHILSYLLLSSDIKGHVEDPASYFSGDPASNREQLDLLMLTQGWRRYNTSEVAKGQIKNSSFYLEAGQSISGKVINLFGKPSKNCDVFAFTKNSFRIGKTDSLGQYLIDGISFQDSTSILLKAKKSKSIADVEIIPDPDVFPAPTSFFTSPHAEEIAAPTEYFDQSKLKYYDEGGMRIIYLDEITVNADKKPKIAQDNFFSGFGDSQITSEDLEKSGSMNILDALMTVPGVQVNGDQVTIRGNTQQPYLLIDGFPEENFSELNYLTASNVESIEIFKGANASIFGINGGNGVISVTLKKGVVIERQRAISLIDYMPLGIQKPDQFYVPKYEVQAVRENSKPDLRTTIYWNPKLKTDSSGTIHVKFYSADHRNNYSVVLEGITDDGEICRYIGRIKNE